MTSENKKCTLEIVRNIMLWLKKSSFIYIVLVKLCKHVRFIIKCAENWSETLE